MDFKAEQPERHFVLNLLEKVLVYVMGLLW